MAASFIQFFTDTPRPRRRCFSVSITDDDLYENVESFTLNLMFDPFEEMQSRIVIKPNVTTIYIEDEDGKYNLFTGRYYGGFLS